MVKYDSTYNLRHYIYFKKCGRLQTSKSFLICNRFKDDAYFIDGNNNKQPLRSRKTNYYNNIMKHRKFLKVKSKVKKMDKNLISRHKFKNRCSLF